MEKTKIAKPAHIKGWGVDVNTADNPAYPMRHDVAKDHMEKGLAWERPTLQKSKVEVLHSNERPNLTAVYGTPVPPRGLSGVLRRMSFKYSESDLRHWMPLLLADRIDMFEGLIDDLRRGHIPNILGELGIKSEIKYNKKGLVRKVIVTALTVGVLFVIIF